MLILVLFDCADNGLLISSVKKLNSNYSKFTFCRKTIIYQCIGQCSLGQLNISFGSF